MCASGRTYLQRRQLGLERGLAGLRRLEALQCPVQLLAKDLRARQAWLPGAHVRVHANARGPSCMRMRCPCVHRLLLFTQRRARVNRVALVATGRAPRCKRLRCTASQHALQHAPQCLHEPLLLLQRRARLREPAAEPHVRLVLLALPRHTVGVGVVGLKGLGHQLLRGGGGRSRRDCVRRRTERDAPRCRQAALGWAGLGWAGLGLGWGWAAGLGCGGRDENTKPVVTARRRASRTETRGHNVKSKPTAVGAGAGFNAYRAGARVVVAARVRLLPIRVRVAPLPRMSVPRHVCGSAGSYARERAGVG